MRRRECRWSGSSCTTLQSTRRLTLACCRRDIPRRNIVTMTGTQIVAAEDECASDNGHGVVGGHQHSRSLLACPLAPPVCWPGHHRQARQSCNGASRRSETNQAATWPSGLAKTTLAAQKVGISAKPRSHSRRPRIERQARLPPPAHQQYSEKGNPKKTAEQAQPLLTPPRGAFSSSRSSTDLGEGGRCAPPQQHLNSEQPSFQPPHHPRLHFGSPALYVGCSVSRFHPNRHHHPLPPTTSGDGSNNTILLTIR